MDIISIIIPVYNVSDYIVKCIDSLVNQTIKNIEILVINDGTKDDSIKKIESNFKDDRIKIFNRTNHGQANARNFALTKAKGNYIFYVDGDDFITYDCLEKMYKISKENKSDLVICDYYKYYDENNYIHINNVPFPSIKSNNKYMLSMPGPVCKLLKKDILVNNNIQFLEGKYFEDNAIMPYAISLCKKIDYIKEPLYYYVQRVGSSIYKKEYDKKWEDIFVSLEHLSNKFEENKTLIKYQSELEYIYIEYLLHAASLRFIDYKEGINNIYKISKIMKEKYPKWKKNKYYKMMGIKYKIICSLLYNSQINLVKKLLRR